VDVAGDDELALLLAETQKNPQNENAHLVLAHALHSKSRERGDAQMLMQAVSSYHQVLTLNSDNADALRGLSVLCLETGILDKALEYLPKYLKLRPEDIQAKTDYAYALVSAERSKEGEVVLKEILGAEPQFVPALMTLAYLRRKAGSRQEAREIALQALAASEDESIRARINSFIAEDPEAGDSQGAVKKDTVDLLSPAQVITGYFKEHPVVSPKLERFVWKSPTKLLVYVKDFPVQDMPEAVRGSFISKAEESLSLLPESIEIVVVSVSDNKPLLSLHAGKSVKR
jgi:tetratricopeptide (TPR) repeat protein